MRPYVKQMAAFYADEGITEALTGDKHFEQAGFVVVFNKVVVRVTLP